MENLQEVKKTGYLVKLTWPIFVELFLQMLVGNVDQFMVGRYSQISVGAIGNANQIVNVLILTFSVISVATTILVTLYIGSNKKEKAVEVYVLSLFVNIILGILVSIILLFFSRQLFSFMRVPDELMAESVQYISIIGGAMVLQAVYLTFTAIFRSNALMKETMKISIFINIINIIGNALFIPHIGIVGAAVSSDISRFIGVIVILYLYRTQIGEKLSFSYLKPFPFVQLKKLLGIGIPSGGESLSYNLSQVAIQTIANGFGTAVINTKVYASMFAMISYLYSNAVSQASQIVVGYLVGAKDEEGTEQQVKRSLCISLAVSLAVSVLLWIVSPYLFGFFSDNKEVVKLGQTIMAIDIFLELGRSVNMVMVRDLQTTGDIRFPVVMSIIFAWGIAVGGGYVLASVFHLGLIGLWIAMTLDECLRAVTFLIRWKSGVWKQKSIIER